MPVLYLPVCPICGAKNSLVRQVLARTDQTRTSYACWECGSVLVWLGDDLWLQNDRWAYQLVGREDKLHLLHEPLTADELRELADRAPPVDFTARDRRTPAEGSEADAAVLWDAPEAGGVVLEAPASSFRPATPRTARPAGPKGDVPRVEQREATALVPMAQVLPEGMTLALVRYEGSQVVPVAVFQEGQLRALPAQRRHGRGSALLAISVVLTTMCLLCSAAAVVLSSFLGGGAAPVALPLIAPARIMSPVPTYTPVPTATPLPTATPPPLPTATPLPLPTEPPLVVLQGVTDYVAGTGSHTIVGEVLNRSGSNLRFVEVMASFYDANGQLIGTGSTFAELSTVEVGGTAPFKLSTQDLSSSFQTYQLRVDYETTGEAPLRLEILDQGGSTADTGAYHITGEVHNPYDFAIRFPEIVASYCNSANQVVRVEMTLVATDTLQAGQNFPFELVLADPPGDLSHYKLQTEAVRP